MRKRQTWMKTPEKWLRRDSNSSAPNMCAMHRPVRATTQRGCTCSCRGCPAGRAGAPGGNILATDPLYTEHLIERTWTIYLLLSTSSGSAAIWWNTCVANGAKMGVGDRLEDPALGFLEESSYLWPKRCSVTVSAADMQWSGVARSVGVLLRVPSPRREMLLQRSSRARKTR